MAYDGWIEFGGVEVVNISRTAQLAEALGIDTVWTTPSSVQWIQDALGGLDYDVPANAPWYDPLFPASGEFAGVIPLSIVGLDDSTRESTPTEYTSDGGNAGIARNKTLPVVANVTLVASTDRGAEYGLRWLNRVLRQEGGGYARMHCSGSDLRYFRFNAGEDAPVQAYRRNVRLTRGSSVTRKRSNYCSASWFVTFTWTAADPYEYSDPITVLTDLGAPTPPGPTSPAGLLMHSAKDTMIEEGCPQFDYTPIYDPLYPALIAPPTAPDFYPSGWTVLTGATFERFWAALSPSAPSVLHVVPILRLSTEEDARMVRVSIWEWSDTIDNRCDPLWSATISYLPAGQLFVIDGVQQACYVWDGSSPEVRRADSLVFGPDAAPVEWSSFSTGAGVRVALDIFSEPGVPNGNGTVRAELDWVQKSD